LILLIVNLGSVLVEGIEGVTKMFVNPIIVDVNIAPSKVINIDSYAPNFHLFGECVLFLLLIN
jgi:hypothetical protein